MVTHLLTPPIRHRVTHHLAKQLGWRTAKHYLRKQEAYMLHKQSWKRFSRCKRYSKGIGNFYQSGRPRWPIKYCTLQWCILVPPHTHWRFTKKAWPGRWRKHLKNRSVEQRVTGNAADWQRQGVYQLKLSTNVGVKRQKMRISKRECSSISTAC